MGRINAVLDEEVDYGFEGGGGYSTDVTELENGFEERDSAWKYPKHEYSASFGDIPDEDRDALINVFHVCRGKRHSFLFKDWNDFTIDDQPIAVQAGTSNKIQLYKRYEFGPAYTIRPIQALSNVEREPVILDENDDPVAGTFNLLTGEFTPVGMWGAGEYRLTCDFYVWVRFDADYNPMEINSWRANTAKVDLIEDRFDFDATNVPESWEE
jgi:uncharacterized protein (TIGR02217 family)